jgi:hypothetical protein
MANLSIGSVVYEGGMLTMVRAERLAGMLTSSELGAGIITTRGRRSAGCKRSSTKSWTTRGSMNSLLPFPVNAGISSPVLQQRGCHVNDDFLVGRRQVFELNGMLDGIGLQGRHFPAGFFRVKDGRDVRKQDLCHLRVVLKQVEDDQFRSVYTKDICELGDLVEAHLPAIAFNHPQPFRRLIPHFLGDVSLAEIGLVTEAFYG